MSTVINGIIYYNPGEVAERLGVSVAMVRYWRNTGRIEGTKVGTTYVFTEEQIQAAKTEPMKRGPKTRDDSEGVEGSGTSVLLQDCTYGPIYRSRILPVGA